MVLGRGSTVLASLIVGPLHNLMMATDAVGIDKDQILLKIEPILRHLHCSGAFLKDEDQEFNQVCGVVL